MPCFYMVESRACIYTRSMNSRLFFAGLLGLAVALGCGGKKKPEPVKGKESGKETKAKVPAKPAEGEWVRGKRVHFTTPKGTTIWLQFNADGSVDVHRDRTGTFTVKGKAVEVEVKDGKGTVIRFAKAGAAVGDKVEVTQDGLDTTLTVTKVESAMFIKTIAKMKSLVGQPLADGEKFFVGRRKGVYLFTPDEPPSTVEAIYREDHTYSILYAHPTLDENGKPTGEVERDLTHGIWTINEGKVYFLDLIWDTNKKSPEADMEVIACEFQERGPEKIIYIAPEEKDEDGEVIPESKYTEEPVKSFANKSMSFYNEEKALKGYDILKAYERAQLISDDAEEEIE